jgi:hypothetical protein
MARRAAARARDDGFADFAARHLFIRDKTGSIVPLKLNAVQRLVHARIVDQRARTGRVRMLVLKARQPGVSTYVEGRFYWLVIRSKAAPSPQSPTRTRSTSSP